MLILAVGIGGRVLSAMLLALPASDFVYIERRITMRLMRLIRLIRLIRTRVIILFSVLGLCVMPASADGKSWWASLTDEQRQAFCIGTLWTCD